MTNNNSLGAILLGGILEDCSPGFQARHDARRAELIAENVAMLKRTYTTPAERAAEVERLSLTHRRAYESANARQTLLTQLCGDHDALNEYLAYLCGEDLLAWAKLLQIFPSRITS